MKRTTKLLALALLASSCEAGDLLVVELKTDLLTPEELEEVRVRVGESPRALMYDSTLQLPGGLSTEARRVAEVPSPPRGTIWIDVDLLRHGEVILDREAQVNGYAGGVQVVTLLISRRCVGVVCPSAASPNATQCLGGACVDPMCVPQFPETCPSPQCVSDGDCFSRGCVRGRCIDAVCFEAPDDASCGSGQRCNIDGECSAAPPVDDAGMEDAGMGDDDAGGTRTRDAGMSMPPDAGPSCGSCDDGNPCTNDTCGPGGCVHSNNSAECDDGAFCNGPDTCSGGTCAYHSGSPCAGAAICDEGGNRCTGCAFDSDCGGPVVSPWGACGGFSSTCDTSGTQSQTTTTYTCQTGVCRGSDTMTSRACSRATMGTACGTGQVCCGETCTNVATDESNCGGCGVLCDPLNAIGTCTSSSCSVGACDAGFGDCTATAGCETSLTVAGNCGACGVSCGQYEACRPNGACGCGAWEGAPGGGSACTDALPNSIGRCANTAPHRCVIQSCYANFGNCNGMPGDGCEIDLRSDESHCGACGNACSAGEVCTNGACRCNGGAACGGGQACRSCGCVPAVETVCLRFGPDEDCDGMANCADPDCEAMLCNAVSDTDCTAGTCP